MVLFTSIAFTNFSLALILKSKRKRSMESKKAPLGVRPSFVSFVLFCGELSGFLFSVDYARYQHFFKVTNKSINQSINQSINRSIRYQPFFKVTNKSINQPINSLLALLQGNKQINLSIRYQHLFQGNKQINQSINQ